MKKNSLFTKIFSGFLITITLFSTILLVSYNVGLKSAVSDWSQNKSLETERIIKEIISNKKIDFSTIYQDTPLFVYDINKKLLFSNRGGGKRFFSENELEPFYIDNSIKGYYHSPKINFMEIEANKQFTKAISKSLFFAVIISTFIILIVALVVSGSISRPAKKIVKFLNTLSTGDHGKTIKVKGTLEVQQITTAVNNLSKELLRESELRSQWARDIAHDLRTPVAAIKAQFEGMMNGALDISINRIKQNLTEVDRMEYLVEDLSELMKLEEPELKLYLDEINCDNFLNQIKNVGTNQIVVKQLHIECFSSIKSFICDEMLLYRAVSNIWMNAIRHCKIKGIIKLKIKEENNKILICIFNNGDIIPENEIEKIFDRLFRGEIARNTKGSGLGLTITNRIVKLHHGTIAVRSKDGYGTEFIISIPN